MKTLRYILLSSILSAAGIASAAPWYAATAIGPAGSVPYAINNRGDMVGYAGLNAFVYSEGSYQTYSAPGAYSTSFNDIADSGHVAGSVTTIQGRADAIRYNIFHGDFRPYDPPPSATGSAAYAVNDSGDLAGFNNMNGDYRAYKDHNGAITVLAPDAGATIAYDISSGPDIVGEARVGGNTRAVKFENNGVTTIGNYAGNSRATAISDATGWIGGDFDTGYNQKVFVRNAAGDSTEYEVPGRGLYLYDLNNRGVGVGDGWLPAAPEHNGYLYTEGTAFLLNDRLVGDTNWDIYSANGINDSGQIAAFGCYIPTGVCQALRLDISPVPEPSSWAMLLAGLVFVGYGARRRA